MRSNVVRAVRHAAVMLAIFPFIPTENASAQTSQACVNGPNRTSTGQYYVCATGGALDNQDDHATLTGPYGVSALSVGTYRFGGDYTNMSEANLATGALKQVMMFGGDPTPYELDSRASLSDLLTFHGTGDATLSTRLTGKFIGNPSMYSNGYSFNLTAWGITNGNFDGRDITSQINLDYRYAGGVTAPTNGCAGNTWSLGITGCTVISNDPNNIIVDISVVFRNLIDGDQIYFHAEGVARAYAHNNGGVDFGSTAQLGLTVDPGMSWESQSDVLLSESITTPEPSSMVLLASGMALLGVRGIRRRKVSRAECR